MHGALVEVEVHVGLTVLDRGQTFLCTGLTVLYVGLTVLYLVLTVLNMGLTVLYVMRVTCMTRSSRWRSSRPLSRKG